MNIKSSKPLHVCMLLMLCLSTLIYKLYEILASIAWSLFLLLMGVVMLGKGVFKKSRS